MGMAVLLGRHIFNIAELVSKSKSNSYAQLDKQILQSLVGTEFEWLFELLVALGHG